MSRRMLQDIEKRAKQNGTQSRAKTRPSDNGRHGARGKPESGGAIATKQSPPKPGLVPIYFENANGIYYARNGRGEYDRIPKEIMQLLLRRNGYLTVHKHDDSLSFLDAELLRITQENSVHFAGTLGGFKPGLYEIHGSRVLVTRGPKLIQPAEGRWDHFKAFLEMLLSDQARYFCAWIKNAFDALQAGRLPWPVGQLLGIGGGHGTGKSVLQTLITPVLGGRMSSPFDFMKGAEKFNADIYGAEHGLIGDVSHLQSHAARRMLGAAIKNLVAEPVQKIRGMHRGGITLTPFLRVSLTLNDGENSLTILPSPDATVWDKIILLRARETDWDFLTAKFPGRDTRERWPAWRAQVESELPAFLYYLRRWKIPETIFDSRWGVKSFHDPDLLNKLQRIGPEQELLEAIDMYIFRDFYGEEWDGKASDVVRELRERMGAMLADKLIPTTSRCGMYLSELAAKFPDRVSMRSVGKNQHRYTIRKETE